MAKEGDRVELAFTTDPYTDLEPGDQGTVLTVDDTGTVHVRWDEGGTLGLVPGEDEFRVIGESETEGE